MRSLFMAIVLATWFVAGAARAASGGGEKGKIEGPHGSSPSPVSGSSAPSGGGAITPIEPTQSDLRWGGLMDIRKAGKGAPKPWEVGAYWETHVMVVQQDTEGQAPNKIFNYMSLYAHADITRYNRVAIKWGFYNRFLCSSLEGNCLRSDDISLSYTRYVPLPWQLDLRLTGSLALPVGYYSQKASLITSPRVSVQLDRRFGHFSVDARVFSSIYFVKYAEVGNIHGSYSNAAGGAQGGSPNLKAGLGGLIEAEYSMPFHAPLVVGADIFEEYLWYYDVANGGTSPYGVVNDPNYKQPVQQLYGAEIFLRYSFPSFHGVKADLTVAYANGDPTLGYNSVIHDGGAHVYPFFWRLNSEFYGVLGARY